MRARTGRDPSELKRHTHQGNEYDFYIIWKKNRIRKLVFQIYLKIDRSHFFHTARTGGGWRPGPGAMGVMFGKIRVLELGTSEVVHPGI